MLYTIENLTTGKSKQGTNLQKLYQFCGISARIIYAKFQYHKGNTFEMNGIGKREHLKFRISRVENRKAPVLRKTPILYGERNLINCTLNQFYK